VALEEDEEDQLGRSREKWEVLHRLKEEINIVHRIKKRKVN
jgi:hypothetical protein